MKKLILILFTLFIGNLSLKAQRTVVINGDIDRAVANQTVWIEYNSTPSTCSVRDTTTTDTLGNFSYTFTVGATCSYNYITLGMIGCKSRNDTIYKTVYYDSLARGPGTDSLTANFTYCAVCVGFKANFKDSATGGTSTAFISRYLTSSSANKFKWTFGNGQSSTLANPNHTYNSTGTYTVCLVAEDTVHGCKDSICKSITIVSFRCLNFNASFNDTIVGDTASFTNTSSSWANKFFWTFGNGQTSTSQSPTHVYSRGGMYTVCLVAQDTINNCSDTTCKSITIGSTNRCSGFTANFYDSIRGDTASFTNTSSSGANNFTWTFGNGQTSSLQNPTHVYSRAGTYTVCLVAKDTVNNCADTTCKTITTSTLNPCTGFFANFNDSIRSDTAHYTSTSSSSANKFTWLFGDGQSSTSQNPMHIYAKDSVYTVCLIAEDTVNRCIDTTCRSITINTASLCASFKADFSFNINCDSVSFVNTSSRSAAIFSWTFGNSNSSTQASPSTTYNTSGTYTACLTVEDFRRSCKDSICKTFTIKNSLQGTIYRDSNQLADSGMVWLIEMTIDSASGDTVLTAIDSVVFSQPDATYEFDNITSGNYLIKAALLPGAAFYSNRIPTYYIQETRWDKATFINVNGPCKTADILLTTGTNPGGAGFIGGFVKQGANKTGDPLNQILVLLYNSDGSPFGYTYTDINGDYEFDNIAYGDYTVVVDVLGKPSEKYTVTINANRPKDSRGNFEVNTKDVTLVPFLPGSVNSIVKGKLNLYPNPTSNKATALFEASKASEATITITDLTGKTVSSQSVTTVTGNNHTELNISELSNGLYIVTINIDSMVYIGRLSITR